MKKKVLSLMIITSIVVAAHAQETKTINQHKTEKIDYKNSIRVLPLPILYGGINFEYEHVIKSDFSLTFQAFGDFYNPYIIAN